VNFFSLFYFNTYEKWFGHVYRQKHVGQDHDTNIDNKSFEYVAKLKYLRMTVTDKYIRLITKKLK
jgi:hypothetical protein